MHEMTTGYGACNVAACVDVLNGVFISGAHVRDPQKR